MPIPATEVVVACPHPALVADARGTIRAANGTAAAVLGGESSALTAALQRALAGGERGQPAA